MKTYKIERTVIEYYHVEANSKADALATELIDPYFIDVQSEKCISESTEASQCINAPDECGDAECLKMAKHERKDKNCTPESPCFRR